MAKNAEFLMREGDNRANEKFLLEYQRLILFALEKVGALDQEQMDKCISLLEKQYL